MSDRDTMAVFLSRALPAIAVVAMVFSVASHAHAASITVVQAEYARPVTLGGDFSGHTGFEGYPTIYVMPYFSAAEAFEGQTVTLSGNFEIASGVPSGPLQTPDQMNGVTLWYDDLQGQSGDCGENCTGEGAVSFSFVTPQQAIGIDIGLLDGGIVTFQFFGPGNTPFEIVTVTGSDASWTFLAETGHRITGVTITNDDLYGVYFDNLRLGAEEPISAPASTWGAVKALFR